MGKFSFALIFAIAFLNILPQIYAENLPISLFNSTCAYNFSHIVSISNCSEININPYFQVEVLLPVKNIDKNISIHIPFIINYKQKFTTFSQYALDKLQVKNNTNITLINDKITVIFGENNILGLDILQRSLLATDFSSYNAGIAIFNKNNSAYVLNWPLDEFKNHTARQKTNEISKNFKKLEQTILENRRKHKERVLEINDAIEDRIDMINQLARKIEQLEKTDIQKNNKK